MKKRSLADIAFHTAILHNQGYVPPLNWKAIAKAVQREVIKRERAKCQKSRVENQLSLEAQKQYINFNSDETEHEEIMDIIKNY